MAVVSLMPLNPQQINLLTYRDTRIHETMASKGGIVEESPAPVVDDKIYVAVGKELNEGKSTLRWTMHRPGGKRICILHIHQPSQRIPLMGTKFSVDQLEEYQVIAHREKEKKEMNTILHDYKNFCEQAGVPADILAIEMDSIEKGIIQLIHQHNIRNLVMGAAAADKGFWKKVKEPKSKKAIYVQLQAPASCQISFIFRETLVHTREGRSLGISPELRSLTNQATPDTEASQSIRSQSSKEVPGNRVKLSGSGSSYHRVNSNTECMKGSVISSSTLKATSPPSMLHLTGNFGGRDGGPTRIPSVYSCSSTCSPGVISNDIASTSAVSSKDGLELQAVDGFNDAYQHIVPPIVLQDSRTEDGLYDQLKQAYAEAENSKREAFEESMRRSTAEKDAINAFHMAKTLETLYAEELKQRIEMEEALDQSRKETEKMKQQLNEVMKELHLAQEQNSCLKDQIANSNRIVQELEQKMMSAVELLQTYKRERDDLQTEHNNTLRLAKERREKQAEEASIAILPQRFSEFSFSEIQEATHDFDPSMKIGEGGYGSIYKGLLRDTLVAIKVLHSHSSQGPLEFQQEVNMLTKLRHPNIVTLIGTCPEASILVYEFCPNGSLEDRLNCEGNTSPISWQARIRIAAELCSVLIFLHSCSPDSIVHCDLKPANILLDAHFVSKLSDFGISRVISSNVNSNNTMPFHVTEPKGTLPYVDPQFLQTGELTVKSDVYSFGVIVLRLLTGRPAMGIIKDVQCALEKGKLRELLDPTAGEWPFVQAKQLAHLAMRCCEMNRRARPDFISDVWKVLKPMRVSCGAFPFQVGSQEHSQIPPYFICSIYQPFPTSAIRAV